jgi:hypothetical protein
MNVIRRTGINPSVVFSEKGIFEIEVEGMWQKVCKGNCCVLPGYVHHRRKVIEPIEFIYIL